MSLLAVGLLLGQLTAVAPSGYTGTFSVGDRTEARLRTSQLGGTAIDVENLPNAVLALNGRRSDLTLGYGPRFALLDIENERTFIVANSARIAAGFLPSRLTRVEVSAEGSIGRQVSAGLVAPQTLGAPNTTIQATTFVPPNAVVYSLSYRVQAGIAQQLSRAWNAQVSVSYGGGKGLDAPSRAIVSPYYGPAAQAAVGYAVTRHDRLTTRARVAHTTSPAIGADFFDATLQEVWSHAWSLRTSGTLGAGLTFYRARPGPDAPRRAGIFPAGEATVIHVVPLDTGEALTFAANARVDARYDPVLQAAQPLAAVGGSSGWASTRYGVTASLEALTTLQPPPGQDAARQLTGSVVLFHAPSRVIRIETGARGYLQDLPTTAVLVGPSNGLQWTLFAALVLQAPPVEF